MTAPGGTRSRPRCHEGSFSSWKFVGVLLVSVELLLPSSSDACDDPPKFQSMMLKDDPKPPYDPGYKIEYKCRPGYTPHVPPVATTAFCQDDNTWTPLQEACKRKSCTTLEDPLNGQVNGTFQFGSKAHYTCNEGYFLIGAEVIYCDLVDSTVDWSDPPPVCEKILCEPPKSIPNGKFTNSHKDTFEYNEVVNYMCDRSTGPDPYSLVGESTLVCKGQNVWSSDPPECKVVKCPFPAVENGQQVSGFGTKFYYKAKVVFECRQGFSLKGNDTIVCEADNMWVPKVPECIQAPTPPSTKPTTSSATARPTPDREPPSEGLGKGIIAAITIGTIAAVTLFVGFLMWALCKRKKNRKPQPSTASYSTYQNKSSMSAEPTH